MPIYEYTCSDCNNEFELLVANHRAKPSCPSCDSKKLQRKFSTFAAHQKSSAPACPSAGQCPSAMPGGPCGGACPMA
ncbi:MAG: FmdB family zinc ribbon protein [Phycisphaerae bacterium]